MLPKVIAQKLQALDRTLRTYAALDGIATALMGIVLLLLVDFVADRFFEFSLYLRGGILPLLVVLTAMVLWTRFLRRASATLPPHQLALLLERYVPDLNESLITAVELSQRPSPESTDPVLLNLTVHQAAKAVHGVRVGTFFRFGRLAGRLATALAVLFIFIGLCFAFSDTSGIWFARNILLSNQDWPRRSRLLVDGFQEGRMRIGHSDSLTMTIRADANMPLVPETIRLRLGKRETGFRTVLLDRFQMETSDGTDWRVFTHTFSDMIDSLSVQVRGADTVLDDLLIEVVPKPIFTEIKLHQSFPAYMDRSDRTVSPSLRTAVPDGTSLLLSAMANKALQRVEVAVNRNTSVPLEGVSAENLCKSIEYMIPRLREDRTLEFHLEDSDQLHNRQPIRMEFYIIKDQVPSVTVRLDGIGSVVTPGAVIPCLGEITDDNGLATAHYRYTVRRGTEQKVETAETGTEAADSDEEQDARDSAADSGKGIEEGSVEISAVRAVRTLFSLDEQFTLAPLNLLAGDRLTLYIEATDKFDLDDPDTGRVGVGPQWSLEIVSPERLRSLLEVREIALRQRFDVLIGEVERTRSIVEGVSLMVPEEQVQQAEALIVEESLLSDADGGKRQKDLELRRQTLLDTISREQANIGFYDLSRALRDTQKEVYDLRTLMESFRLIRLEMINNRIFTDDDRSRLERGIVDPIQSLISEDFLELDYLIGRLNAVLDIREEPLRSEAMERKQAIDSGFEQLIRKMISIRDNMVSMESFNEAVEILRAIIRQQQQLRGETRDQKDERLRNLLSD